MKKKIDDNFDPSKVKTKILKQDSFILENYSKKEVISQEQSITFKKTQISFLKHVKFKIKNVLGLKLRTWMKFIKYLLIQGKFLEKN